MNRRQLSNLTIAIALAIAFLAGRELNTNSARATTNRADDTRLKELLKLRLEDREKALIAISTPGIASKTEISHARVEVLRAKLDLCETKQQRVALLEQIVEQAKVRKQLLEAGRQPGITSRYEIARAEADVLRAELDLCETKAQRIAVLQKIFDREKQYYAEYTANPGCGKFEMLNSLNPLIEAEIALEREKLKP